MKISQIKLKLEGANNDTSYSEEIFKIEEGREDEKISTGKLKGTRRDWLIIADLYGGSYTQKFHLENYLNFRLKNGVTIEDKEVSFGHINNGALLLYIYEVVLEQKEVAYDLYKLLIHYYDKETNNPINKFKYTEQYKVWKENSKL